MNDQLTDVRSLDIEVTGLNIHSLFSEEISQRGDAKGAENQQQTTSKTKNRPIYEDLSLRSLAVSPPLR